MRSAALVAMGCSVAAAACGASQPSASEAAAFDWSCSPGRNAVPRIERLFCEAADDGRYVARVALPVSEVPRVELPAMLPAGQRPEGTGRLDLRAIEDAAHYDATMREPACTDAASRRPSHVVRVERPIHDADGELAYEVIDGALDPTGCLIAGEPRTTRFDTKEILPQLAFAFRFLDPQRQGVELLSVVMPTGTLQTSKSAATGQPDIAHPFSRVTLPVRDGSAESIVVQTSAEDVRAWLRHDPREGRGTLTSVLIIGVELSHAGAEEEAQLVAHVRRVGSDWD